MADSQWKRELGQLLIVGLPGGRLTADDERRLDELAPAGVILFRRNAESVAALRTLTRRLEDLAAEGGFSPLLISADEEGGFLSPVLGLTDPPPAAMALGSAGSEALAFEVAREVGARLRSEGVNLDFAPCVDVNDEPRNPVIGPRAFGTEAGLVSRLGAQMVRGLRAGGVLPTAKHFPGHGGTTLDSHRTLPEDPRTLAELREAALLPFAAAVSAGVDLVMTAHVAFPSVTGHFGGPATLSRRLVHDLLRREMGFGGVIITDALEMAAVVETGTPGNVALGALRAGADLLLHTRGDDRPLAVRDRLVREMESGALPPERIQESLERIRAARAGIPPRAAPGNVGVFSEARSRGIRIVADPLGMVPLQLTPEDELLLLVPDPGLPEGSIDTGDLESAFRARHARATVIRATPTKTVPEDRVRECRVAVVFLISRGPLDAWQAETACRAAALAPRSVLVAAFNPFVFPESVPRAARIATYDFSPPAMRALADRMF